MCLIFRLNEDLLVKVADFGLSRGNYGKNNEEENKKKAMPIRWMSIEAILFGLFTTQSDVVRDLKRILRKKFFSFFAEF